jgi:hypothetical protein
MMSRRSAAWWSIVAVKASRGQFALLDERAPLPPKESDMIEEPFLLLFVLRVVQVAPVPECREVFESALEPLDFLPVLVPVLLHFRIVELRWGIVVARGIGEAAPREDEEKDQGRMPH